LRTRELARRAHHVIRGPALVAPSRQSANQATDWVSGAAVVRVGGAGRGAALAGGRPTRYSMYIWPQLSARPVGDHMTDVVRDGRGISRHDDACQVTVSRSSWTSALQKKITGFPGFLSRNPGKPWISAQIFLKRVIFPGFSGTMARHQRMIRSEQVPQQVTACCDRAVTVL